MRIFNATDLWCGAANAYRISAVGAEHGRVRRSRRFLRDAACPNLVRIAAKEKGRGLRRPQPARWCVWGRAGCSKAIAFQVKSIGP